MPEIYYSDELVTLHHGDCLDVLVTLPDASVDAVVTDPPYGLEFMGKDWDRFAPDDLIKRSGFEHAASGAGWGDVDGSTLPVYGKRRSTYTCPECGKRDAFRNPHRCGESVDWQHTWVDAVPVHSQAFQAWCEQWARECYRVLKPGGHLLAFGGSRMWHRLAAAVEDAGFEVRDSIAWLYGSGFPKSLDVSKAIDKAAGAEREGKVVRSAASAYSANAGNLRPWMDNDGTMTVAGDRPATPDAARWQGWGTALKPAFEPIVVARKPLAGTVAANVLTYGTGALNIGACRITADGQRPASPTSQGGAGSSRGDSTACTCHERAGDQTSRTQSTQLPASSDASPEGRSGLPASAPEGASSCPRSQGSPGGCPSSPCSCGERAQSAGVAAQASVPRPIDAPEPDGRQSVGTSTQMSQSTPCPHCTAPNVQREATRTGEASADRRYTERGGTNFAPLPGVRGGSPAGRWPTNVVLDDTQAAELDRQSGVRRSAGDYPSDAETAGMFGDRKQGGLYADSGGASRFFPTFRYEAKAPTAERPRAGETVHPTVKPLDLMRWLVRLVTPPGGVVLEPFAGSGTTAEACVIEGFRCIAIEREATYLPLIVQRLTKPIAPVLDLDGVTA